MKIMMVWSNLTECHVFLCKFDMYFNDATKSLYCMSLSLLSALTIVYGVITKISLYYGKISSSMYFTRD